MRSHYSRLRTRWVFAAATLAYLLAMVVAPAQHFGEEGRELSAYLAHAAQPVDAPATPGAQLQEVGDPVGEPPGSLPHHDPDEIDCLFCQALSAPAHPAAGELPSIASFGQGLHPPAALYPVPQAPFRTNGARAPPLRT